MRKEGKSMEEKKTMLYLYQYDVTKKEIKKAAVEAIEKPKSYKLENGKSFPLYPVRVINKSDVDNPYTLQSRGLTYISTSENEAVAASLFYDYYKDRRKNAEENLKTYMDHMTALTRLLKGV